MIIDWQIVGIQILNFLFLVWLLKKFLYRPVLDAMDARRNEIVLGMERTAEKEREVERLRDEFEAKNAAFEKNKESMLEGLRHEVEGMKQEWTARAQREVEKEKQAWYQQLEEEKRDVHHSLDGFVQKELGRVVAKAIKDLSGKELEEACIDRFLGFGQGLGHEGGQRVVRTVYPLSKGTQEAIMKKIGGDVSFEVAPELLFGIELLTPGHKMSWNLASYLSGFEEAIHAWKREEAL